MKFIGGLVLGLVIGIGATWFFTATNQGRGLSRTITDRVEHLLHRTPKTAQSAVHEMLTHTLAATLTHSAERV